MYMTIEQRWAAEDAERAAEEFVLNSVSIMGNLPKACSFGRGTFSVVGTMLDPDGDNVGGGILCSFPTRTEAYAGLLILKKDHKDRFEKLCVHSYEYEMSEGPWEHCPLLACTEDICQNEQPHGR